MVRQVQFLLTFAGKVSFAGGYEVLSFILISQQLISQRGKFSAFSFLKLFIKLQ